MVTSEYIGAIMDLCQERRGIYISMEYMEETRALIKYDLPLNEIIYDFFDALKSRSRGYASFDYEMKGYTRSDLVKLDILINKSVEKSLRVRLFVRCAKTYWQNVTVAIFPERENFWRNRKKAKNVCVRSEM